MNKPYYYKDHQLGQTIVRYMIDKKNGQTALLLIPVSAKNEYIEREYEPEKWLIGSLVQLHLRDHNASGIQGMSMRYSPSTANLAFDEQNIIN